MTAKVSAALQLRNDARHRDTMAEAERRLAQRYKDRAEEAQRGESPDREETARVMTREAGHALERADGHDWTALSLRMGAAALDLLQTMTDKGHMTMATREQAQAILRGEGVEEPPVATIPSLHLEALSPAAREKVDALLSAARGRMVFVTFPPSGDSWVREMFARGDQPPVTPVEGWDSAEFPPPPQSKPWDRWTVRPDPTPRASHYRPASPLSGLADAIRRRAASDAFRRMEASDPSALMVVEVAANIDSGPGGRGPLTGELSVRFASGKLEVIRSIDTGLVHPSLFEDLHRYYRQRLDTGLPAKPLRARVVRDGMGQQSVWLPQDFATAYAPAEEA